MLTLSFAILHRYLADLVSRAAVFNHDRWLRLPTRPRFFSFESHDKSPIEHLTRRLLGTYSNVLVMTDHNDHLGGANTMRKARA